MKARLVSCDVIPRDSTLFSPFGIETPKRNKRVDDASAQKSSLRRAFAIFFVSMITFISSSIFWLRGWLKVSKVINTGKHVTEKGTQSRVGTNARWTGSMAVRFGARSSGTGQWARLSDGPPGRSS
jgi:hypothetical protein